jgi:hypothetical protein
MEMSDEGESETEEDNGQHDDEAGMDTLKGQQDIEDALGLHGRTEADVPGPTLWEKLEEVIKDPESYLEEGHVNPDE